MGNVEDQTAPSLRIFKAGRTRGVFKKTKRYLARKPKDWIVVVQDESIFVYETKLRAVWAVKGSKPVVLTTGSHKSTTVYGALAEDGTQLFRQYDGANSDGFLDYIEHMCRKYPKMILFLDKASYHKTEERVKAFFKSHRSSIRLRWFPSGFPEANPTEECWKQGKTI